MGNNLGPSLEYIVCHRAQSTNDFEKVWKALWGDAWELLLLSIWDTIYMHDLKYYFQVWANFME